MSDELVVIGRFNTRPEAELARATLSAAGIESLARADDAGGMQPALDWTSGGIEVIVRKEDADEARDILGGVARPIAD